MARPSVLRASAQGDSVNISRIVSTRPEPQPSSPATRDASTQSPSPNRHKTIHPLKELRRTITPLDETGSSSSEDESTTSNTPQSLPISETTNLIARTDEDLIAALHLVSDSVAQQRQLAAKAILLHPVYWLALLTSLPYLYYEKRHNSPDWPVILIAWVGIIMATMATVKILVHGYLDAAELVGRWSWLYGAGWIQNRFSKSKSTTNKKDQPQTPPPSCRSGNSYGDDDPDFQTDYVFITRLGDEVIAAVVVRIMSTWEINPKSKPPVWKGRETIDLRPRDYLQRTACIRAWTVKQRYRGYGVGLALLRFVVRWALDNAMEGPTFAEDHAHSLRVLPEPLNRGMDTQERRARTTLYWEVQHYSTPWWTEQREERKKGLVGGAGQGKRREMGMGMGMSSEEMTFTESSTWMLNPRQKGLEGSWGRYGTSRGVVREILKGKWREPDSLTRGTGFE